MATANSGTVAQVENNNQIGHHSLLEAQPGQPVTEKGGSLGSDSIPHQEHGPLIDHKIPQVSDMKRKVNSPGSSWMSSQFYKSNFEFWF